MEDSRTRTVTWDDPMIGVAKAMEMSGLDFLRGYLKGDFTRAPISALLNFQLAEVDEGRIVFTVEPAEYHYNPIGVVHGGLACTVLDSAMGCAVHSCLPAGVGYTTLDIHVNLIRPITKETGLLRCEAEAIHVGQRTATAQGRLLDEGGKLYAHATTTCIIFRG